MRLEEPFERFLNGFLLAFHIAAQAGQRHAGMVGDRAVGQDLALQIVQQAAEVADGLGAAAEAREALGGGGEQRFGVGGTVQQQEEIEDFARLQAGAFDVQFVHRRFHVGQSAEIDADGGAPAGGLRAGGGAQVFDGLTRFGEIGKQALAIGVRLQLLQLAASERAGNVAAHQLPQGFEFEDFRAGLQEGWSYLYFPRSRKAFSITASVPSVISSAARSRWRTHSTAQTSSPGKSLPPVTRHT